MAFEHTTVLLNETIEHLSICPNGVYVDGTLGGGGHASRICEKLGHHGLIIGIDQDEVALKAAEQRLDKYSLRKIFIHDNFLSIKNIVRNLGLKGVDGIVLDLGVSSHQLDEASRGFSYMQDADLDMRMNQSQGFRAENVINEYDQENLYRVIKDYGEEKWAKRIAEFIVAERAKGPIKTTGELVDIIKKAIPASARREGPHPAKRAFQAIRIEVNNELGILEQTIKDCGEILNERGRLCIITFHSLEDRIVKNCFKELSVSCKCPKEYPVCICNGKSIFHVVTRKPIVPSNEELEINPRSRSAKLRVVEKV